jgi:hypothetical protein
VRCANSARPGQLLSSKAIPLCHASLPACPLMCPLEARNSQVELAEGAAGGGDSFKRRRHIDRAGVDLGLDTYSPF